MSTTGLSTLVLNTLSARNPKTIDAVLSAIDHQAFGSTITKKMVTDSLRGLVTRGKAQSPIKGQFALATGGMEQVAATATAPVEQVATSMVEERTEEATPVGVVQAAVKAMKAQRAPKAEKVAKAPRVKGDRKFKVRLSMAQMEELITLAEERPALYATLTHALSLASARVGKAAINA